MKIMIARELYQIKKSKFKWEKDTIGKFCVSVQVFHVFESKQFFEYKVSM